jgi:hypothetical protein
VQPNKSVSVKKHTTIFLKKLSTGKNESSTFVFYIFNIFIYLRGSESIDFKAKKRVTPVQKEGDSCTKRG